MFATRLECLEARDKYHIDRIAELEAALEQAKEAKGNLERQNAELRNTAQTAIKAAYYEGFFAMETYNDTQLNDVGEAFNKSDAAKAIGDIAADQKGKASIAQAGKEQGK